MLSYISLYFTITITSIVIFADDDYHAKMRSLLLEETFYFFGWVAISQPGFIYWFLVEKIYPRRPTPPHAYHSLTLTKIHARQFHFSFLTASHLKYCQKYISMATPCRMIVLRISRWCFLSDDKMISMPLLIFHYILFILSKRLFISLPRAVMQISHVSIPLFDREKVPHTIYAFHAQMTEKIR